MIVKVQRSLCPPDVSCLIYNKDRDIMGEFPVTDEIRQVMGDEMKGYFHGKFIKKTGKVELIDRAPDQDW